jgi:hypothetical protein
VTDCLGDCQCLKSPQGGTGFLNGPKVLLTNLVEKHADQRRKHEKIALAALAKGFLQFLKGSNLGNRGLFKHWRLSDTGRSEYLFSSSLFVSLEGEGLSENTRCCIPLIISGLQWHSLDLQHSCVSVHPLAQNLLDNLQPPTFFQQCRVSHLQSICLHHQPATGAPL